MKPRACRVAGQTLAAIPVGKRPEDRDDYEDLNSCRTDDAGRFRIGGLAPGRYRIAGLPPPGWGMTNKGPPGIGPLGPADGVPAGTSGLVLTWE